MKEIATKLVFKQQFHVSGVLSSERRSLRTLVCKLEYIM